MDHWSCILRAYKMPWHRWCVSLCLIRKTCCASWPQLISIKGKQADLTKTVRILYITQSAKLSWRCVLQRRAREILASKTEWCRAQSPTSGLYTCMVVHGLTADATLVRTATALARGREPACQRMLGKHLKCIGWTHFPFPASIQIPHRLFIEAKGNCSYLTYFKSSSMLWLLHINCITNNAN